ncbi:tRNA (cytidine(56)-2'-O)-methyltransferase [Halovenus salina]|uniref:tRNA (cytidine(56)-2'-O)-methyltransferase n=1 Tax=Halovenus salina TaxID=1510225 RepID=A0ABD5VVI2_9EURY|nr:tRNA (cytidine(56)-2'-O)-methyltransferase [Halovenus salina]
MEETPEVAVLRLGHRPGRDERTTTHVGLTARALGADRVILAGSGAGRGETIEDITDRFGGPFSVESTDEPIATVENWEGPVVHLTMYGLPIQEVEGEIRDVAGIGSDDTEDLLVVVGAEKVPFDVYEAAAFNVAVTNQPHSEIASLAVFLDRLFEGRELDREWTNAQQVVVPKAEGKQVTEPE